MACKFCLLFFLALLQVVPALAAPANPASRGDSVQMVLQEINQLYPQLVRYIPETNRLYLLRAQPEAVPEEYVTRLESAFFYDFGTICEYYGLKYLADWRAIASKAARETYWGTSYLCNRTNNYFGIRKMNKKWLCESFGFCETVVRNDPEPAEFVIFPSFEASTWMFIHTIYSPHFLERLPDMGERVLFAIHYERATGIRYWDLPRNENPIFADQLTGGIYTTDELIYTWSEHAINNLCVNCSRETDRVWIGKLERAVDRSGGMGFR